MFEVIRLGRADGAVVAAEKAVRPRSFDLVQVVLLTHLEVKRNVFCSCFFKIKNFRLTILQIDFVDLYLYKSTLLGLRKVGRNNLLNTFLSNAF